MSELAPVSVPARILFSENKLVTKPLIEFVQKILGYFSIFSYFPGKVVLIRLVARVSRNKAW